MVFMRAPIDDNFVSGDKNHPSQPNLSLVQAPLKQNNITQDTTQYTNERKKKEKKVAATVSHLSFQRAKKSEQKQSSGDAVAAVAAENWQRDREKKKEK